MVGFYSHEAMKCCYITVDGILCIQLVIGFIACCMLSHVMYFVRNDEIKMFNQINQYFTCGDGGQVADECPQRRPLIFDSDNFPGLTSPENTPESQGASDGPVKDFGPHVLIRQKCVTSKIRQIKIKYQMPVARIFKVA